MLLSTLYPELTDVWTNHLMTFLMPNVIWMRKQMVVVCWELSRRALLYVSYVPDIKSWKRGCGRLKAKSHAHTFRSFWLNDNVVMVREKRRRLPRPWTTYSYVLHLNSDGKIHCACCRGKDKNRFLTCGHTAISLQGSNIVYHTVISSGNWQRVFERVEEIDMNVQSTCVHRALVLQAIRNR
jgi:hypothetical protein